MSRSGVFLRVIISPTWLALAVSLGLIGCQTPKMETSEVYHPDQRLGQLFEDVQLERVFPDYKTFVDAVPQGNPESILVKYEDAKSRGDFDLKRFVADHFELPPKTHSIAAANSDDMREHLHAQWKHLVRHPKKEHALSSLIQLPNPYIVPGGRFREMFYWDSYFSIVGLLESNEDELAYGMIKNFAFLVEKYGYIPNGNRSYFLGRTQPPFFASMLKSYGKKHGLSTVSQYAKHLETEYVYWMDGFEEVPEGPYVGKHLIVLENGVYFNRYYGEKDIARAEAFGKETRWAQGFTGEKRNQFFRHLRTVCESGWDFSSRWYKNGMHKSTIEAMDLIPVDLNSLMYTVESTIAEFAEYNGDSEKANRFYELAEKRKSLINEYHFDDKTGAYQDFNMHTLEKTGRLTLAMMYPLFAGVAEAEHAESVSKFAERYFLKKGGLSTTLIDSGEQWDYPNGWAPLQYIAVEGLRQYKQNDFALTVAERWLALNERVYQSDGKMMEKYNVVDPDVKAGGGEYPNQDGFGWTNGVDLAFYRLLDELK